MDYKSQIAKGPFSGTIESLSQYECPEWFKNAKFGIWSHWGPQSVPMFGDWYARNMYVEGKPQYLHHWRVYGHPSKVGYKDLIQLWKAENFDPAELMDLFVEAGARYFVAQAVHHDNFDNYDSKIHPWNSVKMGPHKDICALWKKEAEKHGLPFGISEHLGASYTWMAVSHGADKTGPYAGIPYDGADPAYEALYRDNDSEHMINDDRWIWYTTNPKYHEDWFKRIKDVVDTFKPDLLYTDGDVPFGEAGYSIVAHLYNTSAALHGGVNQAVYNMKKGLPQNAEVGVLDIERGISGEIREKPWQDDTAFGECVYSVNDIYKSHQDVIDMLVDIVSKNGNLLLIVAQKPDGTIDDENRYALKQIGAWLKKNGEGIYNSRPYRIFKEGKTELESGTFNEGTAQWRSTDYRFTRNEEAVFAFMMRPEGKKQAVIQAFGKLYEQEIETVEAAGQTVEFVQKDGALYVMLPEDLPQDMPVCIKAKLK